MIRGLFRVFSEVQGENCHIVRGWNALFLQTSARSGDAARPSGRDTRSSSCYMNINPAASSIHYKGRRLPHFDAVIPRIGSAITFYGTAALRQFELLGSYPLNESVAITRARDKLRSLQLLARQGSIFPLPGSPIRRMIPAILLRWLAGRRWS